MAAAELASMLEDKSGLERVIARAVRETDPIDYKVALDRRDPKFDDELRQDCAALATCGIGFLVIGIDESRDGTNRAARLVGLEGGVSLAKSIKDKLGSGFSPPLTRYDAWPIEVGDGRHVVVVRVEGRAGYPIEVVGLQQSPRHLLRAAGQKRRLTSEEARQRRAELDTHARWGRRQVLVAVVVGLFGSVAGWSGALINERRQAALFVDPDLCYNGRKELGGISTPPQPEIRAIFDTYERSLRAGDVALCRTALDKLHVQYPGYVGRYFVEANCHAIDRRLADARKAIDRSERLVRRAMVLREHACLKEFLDLNRRRAEELEHTQ